jgi:hypothetical protein
MPNKSLAGISLWGMVLKTVRKEPRRFYLKAAAQPRRSLQREDIGEVTACE